MKEIISLFAGLLIGIGAGILCSIVYNQATVTSNFEQRLIDDIDGKRDAYDILKFRLLVIDEVVSAFEIKTTDKASVEKYRQKLLKDLNKSHDAAIAAKNQLKAYRSR